MIQLLAVAIGDYAAAVALEYARINTDADRPLHERAHHGLRTPLDRPHAGDATSGDPLAAATFAAITIASSVWVTRFCAGSMALSVFDGTVHETTLASITALVTIHKLLLAQGGEAACADLPSSLHGSRGGETPARATLTLIFHLRDCAFLSPVHGRAQLLTIVRVLTKGWHFRPCVAGELGARVGAQKLLLCEIGELVDAKLISQLFCLGIVRLNFVHVCFEDFKALCLITIVNLAMILFELGKEGIVIDANCSSRNGDVTLHNRVDALVEHTTLIALCAQPDVARLPPRSPPRVLDLERLRIVTDGQHTMIQLPAVAIGDYAAAVTLESARIHTDADRPLHERAHHGLRPPLDRPHAGDATTGDPLPM